jgi:hypothetical protein
MNREDISRMVRDSHLNVYGLGLDHEKFFTAIERFAALVASAERERILGLADSLGWVNIDHIEARGQA